MIKLYKFVNQYSISTFPNWIEVDGKIYTNEAAIPYARERGWKELQVDETPEYDPETQYLAFYYEEQTEYIVKHWEVKEIEEAEDESTN